MRLTGSRAYTRPTPVPKMPPCLVELMEGLTKDVLKNNPDDVYAFCAGHMRKLLDIRDGALPKRTVSLDKRIKIAQEKIKNKIKNQKLQYNSEMLEHPNVIKEQENPVAEWQNEFLIQDPIKKSPTRQPVHHEEFVLANEVEIFQESNVITDTFICDKDSFEKILEAEGGIPIATKKLHQCVELENKEKEEIKERIVNIEGEPIISEPLHYEESTNEIKEEAKETNVNAREGVPITSETLQSGELAEVEQVVKRSKVNLKPVSLVEPLQSNESTTIEIKEEVNEIELKINTKPITQVLTGAQNMTEENYINNTENNLQVTISKEITSASEENINPNRLMVDNNTAITSQVQIVEEVIENVNNKIDTVQQLNESEKLLSDINNAQTQINTDINTGDEEKLLLSSSEVKLGENNACIIDNKGKYDKKDCTESKKKAEQIPNESHIEILKEDLLNVNHVEPCNGKQKQENSYLNHETSTGIVNYSLEKQENLNDQNFEHNQYNIDDISKKDENVIDTAHKFLQEEFIVKENRVNLLKVSLLNNEDNSTLVSDSQIENPAVTGMDLETAAITIQKVFRTFLFTKSRTSTLEDTVHESSPDEDNTDKKDEPEYVISSANLNKERRVLGISRMDTVLQTVNEEKSLSLSTDDSSTLSSAATTIQAHVRGFLVRNKLTSCKTTSNSSLINSEGPSTISIDGDANEPKKTILNIHIVPERGQFMSRDESMLTSIDLPLDNSPPSSVNLHPLGYDKSEPRKQLKREDAIQSISPPSNNSGKLSEEVDSVKDVLNEYSVDLKLESEICDITLTKNDEQQEDTESCNTTLTISSTADTVIDAETSNTKEVLSSPEYNLEAGIKNIEPVANLFSSDEMDVVTPFPNSEKTVSSPSDTETNNKPKLIHSGEFHDIVVQTQVKRSESSVVRGE